MGKVIVAGAGAGKTTYVVREAIKNKDKRILITTYTQANEGEIRSKFVEENGCVPGHVTIQTWFSFLLQDGVRPYQGRRFKDRIGRLVLMNGASALYTKETDRKHYLTDEGLIYSDKIAKLAVSCNTLSGGAVIKRIEGIYDIIYVDELQDITGNDLDFLKLIAASTCDLVMVGDPRQGTYSTNNSAKNGKVRKDKTKLVDFFAGDKTLNISVDNTTLGTNYRCFSTICDLSNKLYPAMAAVTSGYSAIDGHQGLFLVKKADTEAYLAKYRPMQLRWNARTKVDVDYRVMNFGKSKGLTFDRVLIYLPNSMLKWLKDSNAELAGESRAKLYVAITRARHSVAFVCDESLSGFIDWIN